MRSEVVTLAKRFADSKISKISGAAAPALGVAKDIVTVATTPA